MEVVPKVDVAGKWGR